jgi:hypothetical protein
MATTRYSLHLPYPIPNRLYSAPKTIQTFDTMFCTKPHNPRTLPCATLAWSRMQHSTRYYLITQFQPQGARPPFIIFEFMGGGTVSKGHFAPITDKTSTMHEPSVLSVGNNPGCRTLIAERAMRGAHMKKRVQELGFRAIGLRIPRFGERAGRDETAEL